MPVSENLKRVLVSIAAIPLILVASYLGGYFFLALVAVISLLSFYEFCNLVKNKGANVNIFLGGLIVFIFLVNQFTHLFDSLMLILFSSIWLLTLELFNNKGSAIYNLGSTFLGIFYIGLFSASLIALREFYPAIGDNYNKGAYLVISILASIWIGDSAAYYGGTAFGKHKLFPRISPKKSWEGAIFCFIFSLGALILAKVFFLNFLSWMNIIVIGNIIGIIGQIGDLVESMLKRDSDIKDSSKLIPGHGGFLDRFDSLLFSAPAIWIYLKHFV